MPPKVVYYPARDVTAPYFKTHPTVPNFVPADFTRWRDEFVRYLQHLVQHTKYLEYKSIIEANPPDTRVDECRGDELKWLLNEVNYEPRKLVARCAEEFVAELTAASSKPDGDKVPDWMLGILYDNLVAACGDAPDATLIIESHGAADAWAAWLSVNRKFAKAACEEIWRILDEMHKQNLSSNPQDQLAHHRACQAKLTGLCGAPEARDEAIQTFAYLYHPNAKSEDSAVAERARGAR